MFKKNDTRNLNECLQKWPPDTWCQYENAYNYNKTTNFTNI